MHRIGIAVVSGLLSWGSFFIADWLGRWAPGAIFGLLVLRPPNRDPRRHAVSIVISTVVYRCAVWLATSLYAGSVWSGLWSCAVAGVAGALVLSVAWSALRRTRLDPRATSLAAAFGAAGGALIGGAVNAPDESAMLHGLLTSGFVVWQVGFAVSHRVPPATD